MERLQTITGEDIKPETRGILYLCILHQTELEAVRAIQFKCSFAALNAYANIPNPESQLVSAGKENTFNHLIEENEKLKIKVKDPKWIEMLHEAI